MKKIIDEFVKCSKDILQDKLTSIYLHGSAVMGCYNNKKSDIDLIVVVNDSMTDDSKRKYMDMVVELNSFAPAKGIEMSIVTKQVCNPFTYPTPFELHFSVMHLARYKKAPNDYIQKMNKTDKDLAAHFTIIRHKGKCLYGLPIEEVFADVPKEYYMDSIWNDIADASKEISKNTMYLTLNLARVLAYKKEDIILSKKEGGEWALENLPKDYHLLIRDALREYTKGDDVVYDIECAVAYAEYMTQQITSK